MSSFRHQFNPRANIFIFVNLGCEMLYVIDQRLRAQEVPKDKSIQVIHDITAVLLDPKFLDSLLVGSTQQGSVLLTEEHCKFMLTDVATCSLMRLDDSSMDKLWGLMTMVYKWQLHVSKHQHHLLDITMKHLDTISKIYPNERRTSLIDFTKNTLLDFWNTQTDEDQLSIYRTNKAWLKNFGTKISLLIRLGFQALDSTFIEKVDQSYYQDFVDNIGENIYTKSCEVAEKKKEEIEGSTSTAARVDNLAELLNITQTCEDLQPMDVNDLQKQVEASFQNCNLEMNDSDEDQNRQFAKDLQDLTMKASLDMNLFPDSSTQAGASSAEPDEFIKITATYSAPKRPPSAKDRGLKNLFEIYHDIE